MSGLVYVGKTPATGPDVMTRLDNENILAGGVSRGYVTGRAHDLAVASYATKVYVDTQDETFSDTVYYPAQDALLVPNSAKGQPNGIATLVGGLVPVAQIPVLGAGILKGPYGHTAAYTVTTGTTPVKFADISSVSYPVNSLQPLVFMTVICIAAGGARPVIEVRMSTTGATTYAAQTLIAAGKGRSEYNDSQTVVVMPVTALTGEGQDGVVDTIASGTTLTITAWIFDDSTHTSATVNTQPGYVLSTAMYLPRSTL